jgi:hypothetical protein
VIVVKKTLENCNVIKEAIALGVGMPNQYEGKCEGYDAENREEPLKRCKCCKLNTMYEE